MTTKQIFKISSAFLFLYSVFGYLFPEWGGTVFSNNENLAHLITAIILSIAVELPYRWQKWLVLIIAFKFIVLGLYGFAHVAPTDIALKNKLIPAHLDTFDDYSNITIGLAFAWIWIKNRRHLA